jgi:glucokinase
MEVEIGVDMGGTRIKIGLVHKGKLIADTSIQASAHMTLAERLVEIGGQVDRLLEQNRSIPTGIGIAFPGIVDSVHHKILSRYVKYPDAQEVNLPEWAVRRWNIPLVLENDARAALVGEWQYGSGRNSQDLVLITLGTGVGSAVMMEGRMLKGRHFLAGNLGGHMTINLHGGLCNCGNIGCLETEGSTWALEGIVKRTPGYDTSALSGESEIGFHTVFKLAEEGDALAGEVSRQILKAWSLGIINLIHAYDPERVVIGGGVMRSKEIILPVIRETIRRHSWLRENEPDIVAAEQPDFAGILGMSHLVSVSRDKHISLL